MTKWHVFFYTKKTHRSPRADASQLSIVISLWLISGQDPCLPDLHPHPEPLNPGSHPTNKELASPSLLFSALDAGTRSVCPLPYAFLRRDRNTPWLPWLPVGGCYGDHHLAASWIWSERVEGGLLILPVTWDVMEIYWNVFWIGIY